MDATEGRLVVHPWPSEVPLRVLMFIGAVAVWGLLLLTIVGLVYGVLIFIFLFLSHFLFIAYLRGSAVKLGPAQFPELHERVLQLAGRIGLEPAPQVYLMQAEGALNALATRFLRARFVVLFSDLLDACEGDEAARDMIIGHELGHLRRGHLDFLWLILPGMIIPFLGSAYSRACEYTCDRFGFALAGGDAGALRGLAILAAGGRQGPNVNLQALVNQQQDLNTGWMTLGRWLQSHPPLCHRIAVLKPELAQGLTSGRRGSIRALAILGALVAVPVALGGLALIGLLPAIQEAIEAAEAGQLETQATTPLTEAEARRQTEQDFAVLASLLQQMQSDGQPLPEDVAGLYAAWESAYPEEVVPIDPFDGQWYGYSRDGEKWTLWSSGPDGLAGTGDDLLWSPLPPPGGELDPQLREPGSN